MNDSTDKATGRFTNRRGGFTLAELLVASVVTSVALLGVHGIFFRALAVESRASTRWANRQTAEAAADAMSAAAESAVNIPHRPALTVGRDEQGGGWMICQTPRARLRYRWQRSDRDDAIVLRAQSKPFAGSRELTVGIDPAPDETTPAADDRWDAVESSVVAKGLSEVSVRAWRPGESHEPTGDGTYQGPVGRMAVEIQVAMGEGLARRLAIPRCGWGAAPGESQGGEDEE